MTQIHFILAIINDTNIIYLIFTITNDTNLNTRTEWQLNKQVVDILGHQQITNTVYNYVRRQHRKCWLCNQNFNKYLNLWSRTKTTCITTATTPSFVPTGFTPRAIHTQIAPVQSTAHITAGGIYSQFLPPCHAQAATRSDAVSGQAGATQSDNPFTPCPAQATAMGTQFSTAMGSEAVSGVLQSTTMWNAIVSVQGGATTANNNPFTPRATVSGALVNDFM